MAFSACWVLKSLLAVAVVLMGTLLAGAAAGAHREGWSRKFPNTIVDRGDSAANRQRMAFGCTWLTKMAAGVRSGRRKVAAAMVVGALRTLAVDRGSLYKRAATVVQRYAAGSS